MLLLLFIILWLIIWITLLEKELKKARKSFNKKFNALVRRIKHTEENQNITFDYINDIYSDLERLDINEEN